METKGVLDRIVDGKHAVILAEEIKREFVLDVSGLPEGSKEGSWFDLEIKNGEIVSLEIDEEETQAREERISKKMARLKKRSRGSRFRRG